MGRVFCTVCTEIKVLSWKIIQAVSGKKEDVTMCSDNQYIFDLTYGP